MFTKSQKQVLSDIKIRVKKNEKMSEKLAGILSNKIIEKLEQKVKTLETRIKELENINETLKYRFDEVEQVLQDVIKLNITPEHVNRNRRIRKNNFFKPRPLAVTFAKDRSLPLIHKNKRTLKNGKKRMRKNLSKQRRGQLPKDKFGQPRTWVQDGKVLAFLNNTR